jgi:lysine N6-hydroxylase
MITCSRAQPLDLAGVGIGPFNLSLAALLTHLPRVDPIRSARTSSQAPVRFGFYDRRDSFQWHPGLLFPQAELQVSHLKDLVTLVDPTNPCSFLAFLANQKRLYRFIIARFPAVKRVEFDEYYRWVSKSLPDLYFGSGIAMVDFQDGLFRLQTDNDREVWARNVVLATGMVPNIPDYARDHIGSTVFHASTFRQCPDTAFADKRVTIVGGGQTGAELALHLLNLGALPRELHWISRRANFLPMDDSPFTNEFYVPSYNEFFFDLPAWRKIQLLREQKLSSDGISERLLDELYRRLYSLEFHAGRKKLAHLRPVTEATGLERRDGAWRLQCRTIDGRAVTFDTDYLILATGFAQPRTHKVLQPLMDRIPLDGDGRYNINRDFSIQWDGPDDRRLYVQNASRHAHGVMDPNLSLVAWRNAVIINSLLSEQIFDIGSHHPTLMWDTPSEAESFPHITGRVPVIV